LAQILANDKDDRKLEQQTVQHEVRANLVSIKLGLQDEWRRFAVSPQYYTFAKLEADINRLFNTKVHTNFLIKYQDDEGDSITITTDYELNEAMQFVTQGQRPYILKLSLAKILPPLKKRNTQSTDDLVNCLVDSIKLRRSKMIPDKLEREPLAKNLSSSCPPKIPNPSQLKLQAMNLRKVSVPQSNVPVSYHPCHLREFEPIDVMLKQLESMGFNDRRRNIQACVRSRGDVASAIMVLLSSGK